jgi:hypothetical protein
LIFAWTLAVVIPTSYSKGRLFETHRIELANGIERRSIADAWPVVFALTVKDGEPESIHRTALAGVLLFGLCIVSVAFDFAPKRQDDMSTSKQKIDVVLSEDRDEEKDD